MSDADVTFASLGLTALLIGQLLQAVGDGSPFERCNPRCLRQLALLIAVDGLGGQLLALAEAFRRGRELTDDVAGLV